MLASLRGAPSASSNRALPAATPERARALSTMPQLSVVVPTFNERGNVDRLVHQLESVLQDLDWEVLFVDDDSPDGTAERVNELARNNQRVRCLRRLGRRGLSSACIEGMTACASPYLAVMDADLQHDESLLPEMLKRLSRGGCDIVVGSRYAAGGSSREGLSAIRSAGSRLAVWLSRFVLRQELSDPMSGYFMLRREIFEDAARSLYGKGFKILLDIIAAHKGKLLVTELSYEMRPRKAGETKLDSAVVVDFLMMLIDHRLRSVMPARFLLFILVGLTGVGVHMGTLYLAHLTLGSTFAWAQSLATFVAMTSNFNFFLNNAVTFRDRRLHGVGLLRGLLSFYLACSLGALINVALASFLFDLGAHWAVAGLAGAAVGAVWNFALSSYFTWRNPGG
jgi:dolichol-phosphate mannosyltransferase